METNGYKINEIDIKKVVEDSEKYDFEDPEYNYLNIYYDRDTQELYAATYANNTDSAILPVGTIYEPISEDELRSMIIERFEPMYIIYNENKILTAEEALAMFGMELIVNSMDRYTMEIVHSELLDDPEADFNEAEFINAYLAKGAYHIEIS